MDVSPVFSVRRSVAGCENRCKAVRASDTQCRFHPVAVIVGYEALGMRFVLSTLARHRIYIGRG